MLQLIFPTKKRANSESAWKNHGLFCPSAGRPIFWVPSLTAAVISFPPSLFVCSARQKKTWESSSVLPKKFLRRPSHPSKESGIKGCRRRWLKRRFGGSRIDLADESTSRRKVRALKRNWVSPMLGFAEDRSFGCKRVFLNLYFKGIETITYLQIALGAIVLESLILD